MVARHCIIKGRVQGVGFRYFTFGSAEQHDIGGWVKNLSSGEVELYATGDEDAMARFMSDIEKGPSLALVEHIEVRDVAPEPCSGFLIER